jgi:Transposase and inactivated derivatives
MNPFHGRHFQGEIILWAVRWYCKYGISYRELQEMLAERGVNVDHTTIYRWVQRYAPERALLHKDLKCKAPLIEPNLRRNLGKWST